MIQSSGNASGTGNTCAFTGSPTSGNTLIVASVWDSATGTPTVTDTLGSTWTQGKLDTANTVKGAIYVASAASTGADTVTVSETSATFQKTACLEIPATWGVTVDVSDSKVYSGTPATVTSNSFTTTVNGDFIYSAIGGFQSAGKFTAGTGYTFAGNNSGGQSLGQEFQVAGTNGSYTASFNNFTNTQGVILTIALKPASTITITDYFQGLNNTALPDGAVQQGYDFVPQCIGGAGAYTWSLSSGTLQSPLTLNSSTGEISGTPVQGGTRTVTLQCTDGTNTATATVTLRIGAALNTISASTIANCGSFTPSTGDIIAVLYTVPLAMQIPKITDSLGTVYRLAATSTFTTDPAGILTFVGSAPSSASNSISASGGGATRKMCIRFANAQVFLDGGNVTTGTGATGTTTITSNSLSTIVPNEVLISSAYDFTTAGSTLDVNSPFTNWGTSGVDPNAGYQVATTATGYTVAYASTGNTDGRYIIELFAMRPTVNTNFIQAHALRKLIGPF